MSYISTDNRTDILLETLQDVEKLVGDIQPGMKITEVVAARAVTGLQMIYMAARRHPGWLEPDATKTPEPETEFRQYVKPVISSGTLTVPAENDLEPL